VFLASPAEGKGFQIFIIDLQTGKRTPWIKIDSAPGDVAVISSDITSDGRSYVYSNRRYSGDLYLLEGLR
jgi:hypothetical protein